MIRFLDLLWFRLLHVVFRAALRCGHAHCRREQIRHLRRQLAQQNTHLN